MTIPPETDTSIPPAPIQPDSAKQIDRGPDILIADDEVSIASVIAETLAEEGYAVQVVHDGASALLAIKQQPPKLALLDIAMPVITGDELLAQLRREGFSDLPIILMSAGTQLQEFLARGATAVIPKPFALENLLDYAQQYTRRRNEWAA